MQSDGQSRQHSARRVLFERALAQPERFFYELLYLVVTLFIHKPVITGPPRVPQNGQGTAGPGSSGRIRPEVIPRGCAQGYHRPFSGSGQPCVQADNVRQGVPGAAGLVLIEQLPRYGVRGRPRGGSEGSPRTDWSGYGGTFPRTACARRPWLSDISPP